MIVCSCNAIREDELREAVRRSGAETAEAAYKALGCEFECGSCADYAQEIIDGEHRSCAGGTARSAAAPRGAKLLKFPQAA